VGYRQSPEELTDLKVVRRLNDKMPMIGHYHHRKNGQWHDFPCFVDDPHHSSMTRIMAL